MRDANIGALIDEHLGCGRPPKRDEIQTSIATNAILVRGMRYIRDRNPGYDHTTIVLTIDDKSSKNVCRGIVMVNASNAPNSAPALSSSGDSAVEGKASSDRNTPDPMLL